MSSASGYMGATYFQEFGQTYIPVLRQEYMPFFCLPLSSQPRLNLLSTQQHGMSSASGYMVVKYFQEFASWFLTCPQLVGTWVQNSVRNLVPQISGALHSKCCLSWRVNIYRVNKFCVVSCQNSACQHVHAMSWLPCASAEIAHTTSPPRVDSSKGPKPGQQHTAAIDHQGKYAKHVQFLHYSGPWKNVWNGMKKGQEDLFPTKPDLAHILGRTDLDF